VISIITTGGCGDDDMDDLDRILERDTLFIRVTTTVSLFVFSLISGSGRQYDRPVVTVYIYRTKTLV